MTKNSKVGRVDLEKSFHELEALAQDLQNENLDLEKSLDKFERGLRLAEIIRQRLATIENKIKTIRLKYKDTLEENLEEGDSEA